MHVEIVHKSFEQYLYNVNLKFLQLRASSIVNDGIREIYTFLREDPTRTKSTKSTKSDFLYLRCFYADKKHKKHKKYKTSNKRLLPLRRFLCAQKCSLFYFYSLIAFRAFYPKQVTFFLLDVFMHI